VLAVSSVGARERVEEHAGAPAVARLGEHLKPEQPRHGVAVECRGCETAASPSVQFCLPEHERGGDGFEEGTFDKRCNLCT
jgi:hypothetical protein